MKYCQNCGNALMDQEDRCRKCGKQVPLASNNDQSIMASVAVAAITDSAAIGYLADDGLPGSMSMDEMIGGPADVF